jgi:hypothetical protein
MSGLTQRLVILSAALLPPRIRARYREQWLGELRDAPELGIRSSEIAIGSLAFAATFGRASIAGRRPSPQTISRRARLAIALEVSAAGLAFGQLADSVWDAQTGTNPVSAAIGFFWTLLTAYAFVAPIVALFTVLATRGMSWWIRGGVVILAGLCALPLTLGEDNVIWLNPEGPLFFPLATITFPTFGFFLAFVTLTGRRPPTGFSAESPTQRTGARRVRGLLAALTLAVLAWAAFAMAFILWSDRPAFRFGSTITMPQLRQTLAINASIAQSVAVSLGVWLAFAVIAAIIVAVFSMGRRSTLRRSITLALVALGAMALSFGSLVSYIYLVFGSRAPGPPINLLTEVAQVGLVVALIVVAIRQRLGASVASHSDVAVDLLGSAHG